MIELVEIANQVLLLEWEFGFLVTTIMLFELLVQALPSLIVFLAIVFVLFHSILLLLAGVHSKGFLEGKRIDFFQDCLESDERLLQDFVPMLIS